MKVVTLIENRSISNEYKHQHGLSLYIETEKHKILFDTGADESFIDNASKLGVNLEDIDIAVISHGHYDHGGGLEGFLRVNNKAKIYIGRAAFEVHLKKILGIFKYNIGLKKDLAENSRFVFVHDIVRIDDEIILFNNIKGSKLLPKGNDKLLKKSSSGLIEKDDFEHEINLLIRENGRYNLVCGCAHRGIVNIIERAREIINKNLNAVIGGFHLMRMKAENPEHRDFLGELTSILGSNEVAKYYTCHCTGNEAYSYLSNRMNNLNELKTGMIIDI